MLAGFPIKESTRSSETLTRQASGRAVSSAPSPGPWISGVLNDWQTYHSLITKCLRPSMTILEVGCGTGDIAPFPWEEYPDISLIGLDPSPASRANPHLSRFVPMTGESRWPVENESADLVLARYVMEHVPAPAEFFRNIRRVLKPGGRFVFLTPNLWHPAILTSHVLPVAVKRAILWRTMGVDEADIFPTFYRLNRRSLLASIGRQNSLSVEHLQTREFSPCTYADRFVAGRLLFRGYYDFMRTTGLGRHFGASIIGVFRKDTHPSREVSRGSAPA